MNGILLPPAYLAPAEYYSFLISGRCTVEQYANYNRHTYANRCDILTAEVSEYFYPQLDVETTLGNVQYVSWGLSRHKGLDERVDAFIDSVKAEPVFIELQRKYYK